MNKPLFLILTGLLSLIGCKSETTTVWEWNLPEHFPIPSVPEDNPMSQVKVDLGRFLFYDTRLSVNDQMSCASCHEQSLAFTDGKTKSEGTTGEMAPRNSMSLANITYSSRLTLGKPSLGSPRRSRAHSTLWRGPD